MRKLCALLTRPRAESEALAVTLAAEGVESLIEPLIDIAPLPDVAIDLGGVQALLLTSANGARVLAAALPRNDAAFGLPVFAVGDATATAARQLGFAQVKAAGGDVQSLTALVEAQLSPDGGRLLHTAGRAVAGDLVGGLRASGFDALRIVLYEATAAETLSEGVRRALAAGGVDLALFFSPRTARVFVKLANDAALADAMPQVVALCLSDAVAQSLSVMRWRHVIVAGEPTLPAVIDAVRRAATTRDPAIA